MRVMNRRHILALAGCLFTDYACSWTRIVFAGSKKSDFPPVRFGVLSDPHVNLKGVNRWKMGEVSLLCLQATIRELNKEELDFVLIPGDLLNDGELPNLGCAKKNLDTLKAPYFIVAGNHDYQPADPARRIAALKYVSVYDFAKTFRGHGFDGADRRYWAWRLKKGLRLIGLDGCLIDEEVNFGGHLPQQQMKWLKRQLATHKNDLHIIMLHHNLVHWGKDALSERGRWFSINNSEEVRNLLEEFADNIGVVFSGHRHVGLRQRRLGNIDYVVVPSINSYPMRYSLFQISGGELRWKTPGVPVGQGLHNLAREGLLSQPWLLSMNLTNEEETISFYENNPLTSGFCQL